MIIISKVYKILFINIVKIGVYIFCFKKISVTTTQFLKIFFKINENAEIINLMLIYQVVSLFFNNKLRFSICDFFMIDEVSIVIHM